LINYYKAFNIISIPRLRNVAVDTLANATIGMLPLKNGFSIEIKYKPSVPNNSTNFHVFNDDQ